MRQEAYSDMIFWLERGCNGFRIDSMNLMSKHPDLPDAPITDPNAEFQSGALYFASGPRMHDYLREMREQVFDKYDCMTVGELGFTKDEKSVSEYVAKDRRELDMLFTGDIVDVDFGDEHKYGHSPFHVSKLRNITSQWQSAMPKFQGWNTVYMDNHDSGRSLSRYGSDAAEFRKASAKMLATYMCTLSGTLFLLQGQEIGMANMPKSWGVENYIDVEAKNYYNSVLKARGEGADMSDVMSEMRLKARDNGRLPMQWDASESAGFTEGGKPWMRVNDDFKEWNVASQENDPDSVLSYWREMLALRMREKDVFVYGKFSRDGFEAAEDAVIGYTMTSSGGKKALVLLNFSDKEQSVKADGEWKKLTGNCAGGSINLLRPYEGAIYCN